MASKYAFPCGTCTDNKGLTKLELITTMLVQSLLTENSDHRLKKETARIAKEYALEILSSASKEE